MVGDGWTPCDAGHGHRLGTLGQTNLGPTRDPLKRIVDLSNSSNEATILLPTTSAE